MNLSNITILLLALLIQESYSQNPGARLTVSAKLLNDYKEIYLPNVLEEFEGIVNSKLASNLYSIHNITIESASIASGDLSLTVNEEGLSIQTSKCNFEMSYTFRFQTLQQKIFMKTSDCSLESKILIEVINGVYSAQA